MASPAFFVIKPDGLLRLYKRVSWAKQVPSKESKLRSTNSRDPDAIVLCALSFHIRRKSCILCPPTGSKQPPSHRFLFALRKITVQTVTDGYINSSWWISTLHEAHLWRLNIHRGVPGRYYRFIYYRRRPSLTFAHNLRTSGDLCVSFNGNKMPDLA